MAVLENPQILSNLPTQATSTAPSQYRTEGVAQLLSFSLSPFLPLPLPCRPRWIRTSEGFGIRLVRIPDSALFLTIISLSLSFFIFILSLLWTHISRVLKVAYPVLYTRSRLNSFQSLVSSLKGPFPENSNEDCTASCQFDLEFQKFQEGWDWVWFLLTIISLVPAQVWQRVCTW